MTFTDFDSPSSGDRPGIDLAALDAALDEIHDVLGAVVTGLNARGSWSASGSFPAQAAKGDFWIVSRAGMVDGQAFAVGDWLIALVSEPSTSSFEGNWTRADYSRVVPRVHADVRALRASSEVPRGAGGLWQTGDGFHFVEAPAGAADPHITTAGGVGLYAVARLGVMTPLQFGAEVDNTSDDRAAVQSCATHCCRTGQEFRLNSGATRVSGPIRFGLSLYRSWAGLAMREGPWDPGPVTDMESYNLNRDAFRGCVISAESGAVLVAAFVPDTPTPVLEYNLHKDSDQGLIRDLVIATPDYVGLGGRIAKDASTVQVPNLIGIASARQGLREVSGCRFLGMGAAGFAGHANYWLDVSRCEAWRCGTGFNLSGFNAGTAQSLQAWYCDQGLVADGDAMRLQISCQQTREEVWIMGGDTGWVETGYLEDVDEATGDGAGRYAVRTGVEEGRTNQVLFFTFQGLRVGARREGKRAYRLWGLSRCTFLGAREYSGGVDADGVSHALLVNTDFGASAQLPIERFGRITARGAALAEVHPGGATIKRRDVIPLAVTDFGTIAPGGTVTRDYAIADVTPLGSSFVYADVKITRQPGIPGDRRISMTGELPSATLLRVHATNPTASGIGFEAALMAEITLLDAAVAPVEAI